MPALNVVKCKIHSSWKPKDAANRKKNMFQAWRKSYCFYHLGQGKVIETGQQKQLKAVAT